MTDKSKTLLFKSITELTEISVSSLDKLFEIASQQHLKKGAFILKQGKICKSTFFVEKGYLRTFIVRDGIEINTDFTFEGSFTTNLKSLRMISSSENSIQAGETTTIYKFAKNDLLELYNESPEIESFGRKLLEHLLIVQEDHTNLIKIHSAKERYQYIRDVKPEMLQRISLSQLSSYLGMTRETLSRIRKQ